MDVSKELMREHQFILKYNHIMVQFAEFIETSNDTSSLNKYGVYFTDFISEFADEYHHSKEEDILFQELVKPGTLSHCNPIPVMLHEHDLGRSARSSMIEAINENNINNFKRAAIQFKEILDTHIFKEDNVLYPMAEESLTEEKKIEINSLYKTAEETHEKEAIWVKFTNMLEEIENLISVNA